MKKILILHRTDSHEISTIVEKLNKDFEVFTGLSMLEAIKYLNENDIFMLFSELSFITQDGTSFLEVIKNKFPNIIRIILGGDVEEPQILKEIQRNLARTCLLKPWQNRILELAKKLSATEEKLNELKISLKIINPNDIPTIKDSYTNILHMIDHDGDMDKIADAISSDPVIAVKILRIANSAYFGIKTTSVKHAVVYLGFRNIRELVLASAVYDAFNKSDVPENMFQPFWQQAFMNSKVVTEIYRLCGKKAPAHATTTGLFANIGIIFLLNLYGKRYFKLIQEMKQQNEDSEITLEYLEIEELGVTHSQVGGYLLNYWGIPYSIVEGVIYHHVPTSENIIDKELLCILHLAEYYTTRQIYIQSSDSDIKECCTYLGISQESVEKIIDSMA